MASDVYTTDNVMVGFIGAGKMAQAMCRGFLASGLVRTTQLTLSDPNCSQTASLEKLGVTLTQSNRYVVNNTDVVFLAVKPNKVCTVLRDIKNSVTKNHIIVSIAAGVSLDSMEKELPIGTRVLRVMPNTPSLVNCGASAYSKGKHAKPEDGKIVSALLSTFGIVEEIEEKHMDAVCGVSGSGPAYMYMAIEAMADGGVKMGLTKDLAMKLAAQTMMGAAKMVLESKEHPAVLRDAVCSPGGTTIHAVSSLEKNGYRNALISAVESATLRSQELGKMEVSQTKVSSHSDNKAEDEEVKESQKKAASLASR